MAARPHVDPDIPDDMAFQRRMWAFERTGWIIFGVILFAAAIGLFGGGGIAWTETATDDSGLSVQYERFARVAAPMRMHVTARPMSDGDSSVRIWLAREYVDAMIIDGVTPQPAEVEAAADRLVFEFTLVEPGETAAIVLDLEPRERWRVPARLGVEGGSTLEFNQFIYP